MRLIGLDPGLQRTGWGVIEAEGNRLRWIAAGVLTTVASESLAERLVALYRALSDVVEEYAPQEAAVEETFVNKNPSSTLKLGNARAISLVVPALMGLRVSEYTPNAVKKAVVGSGHAEKEQVQAMVARLLPGSDVSSADAADALAVAICHAHNAQTSRLWAKPARAS
jgi:crossover junction endodeoxyribonuclease RuvC